MRFLRPLLAAAVLAVGAHPVAAEESIDAELTAAAKDIAGYLKGRGAKSLAIREISSKSDDKISHGPGLALQLKDKLAAAGVTVNARDRYVLTGEYAGKKDKSARVFIQLDLTLTDMAAGGGKQPFPRAIFGEDALIELLAPASIAIPPGTPDDKREDFIVRSIDDLRTKPQWDIDGAVVYAGKDREYGVEFLVKEAGGGYKGRAPKEDDGDLVIDLKKGESFRIRLINKSKHEVAAKVMIDGISTFSFGAFQKMDPKPRWIVPAGRPAIVAGWPSDTGRSREFLVTDYDGSAVAELGGDRAKLGVLTVEFAASWPKNTLPPADEPDLKGAKGSTGIGRGAEFENPLNRVERTFGRTRATISLRYNK